MSYTYSGLAEIPSGKFVSGIAVTLPSPGFPNSNYSVSVNSIDFSSSSVVVNIYDGTRFWIGGDSGSYLWIATNQNGSGGGGSPGPTGATGTNGTNGAKGATGATGTNGTNGATGATGTNGTNGINGTNGATGVTGDAATINVFSTTTLVPGSNALVTNSGTPSAVQLNFGIPRGDKGATGTNGTNGAKGATGTEYNAVGPWVEGNYYPKDTIVVSSIDNNTYVSTRITSGIQEQPPENTEDWALFIEHGEQGIPGTDGTTFAYIGTWIEGSYAVNTLAVDSLDNNTYVCIVQTEPPYLDNPPSTLPSNWTLFANGGATGADGADGQSSSYFDYQADNGVTPSTGHLSWSNFASQTSSIYIRVNHINQDGVDIDIFLNLVQQGNTLIIQDKNVSANFQRWLVNGTPIPNTGSGYVQYPVTLTSSGGSPNFANNHALILATIVPGPQGPQGATGATGATGPMNPGLYNKLQIVPVATPTSSTVVWSSLPAPTAPIITNPNTWVWDSSTSSPTAGTGNSWRFSKTALQTTSISWAMFSQVASMTASGPPPLPSIPKNTLEAVYFLIKPTINIVTTPANTNPLTLNIYSYSGTGFFNTRWGYNILGTGTTLVAGYTYLLYAFDVAVTSTGANGTIVPPTQTTFLRDPYDIYTDIPHIGMQNVVTSGSVSAGYDSAPITVIAINSTAGLITGGVDFIITKCGYKAGGTNIEYTLNFT